MSDIAGQSADAAAGVSGDVANAAVGSGPDYGSPSEPSTGTTQQDNSGGGVHPAWQEMLDKIPSGLHPMVTPYLQDWDKNVQKKLSEVQSQYQPFEEFKDQDPAVLKQAIAFWQLAESDPERVFNEMQKFYGFGGDQGQQGQEDDGSEGDPPEFDIDGDDILQHPKVQELLQNQEMLAEHFLKQQEAEQAAEFERQVDAELATIMEANPQFTEQDQIMVFRIAAASNISLTEAAAEVKGYADSVAQRNATPESPSVMRAGGQVPAVQNVDPRTLDRKQTKDLVAQILTQAQG